MPSSKPGPLILVVDDYEDAREMYAEYLQFSGLRAATARNGDEAIALARKLKPALILMDLSMPGMDGWEATRILKGDESTRHIPVIALTGHALAGNEEEALKSGCDGFIAKPCLPPDLVAKVKASLASPAKYPTMDERPGTMDRPRAKVSAKGLNGAKASGAAKRTAASKSSKGGPSKAADERPSRGKTAKRR